jgi:UTP--glucose-1-phosphate uridylyltransferase
MVSPEAASGSERESGVPHGHDVRKAIIPLAGLGTRLLPATKAVPKGMLPLIDKPVVQYIVEEAAAAGLTDIVLVTNGEDDLFDAHFGHAPHLERLLGERNEEVALRDLSSMAGLARISSVVQDRPRGLGDAVLRCAGFVGDEPFAILHGDNVLRTQEDLLTRLVAARRRYGGTVLALTEVPRDDVSSRGVVTFERTADPNAVRVTDLVEKPAVADAPSNWIMIGRYICDPAIFDVLRETPTGHGAELQLSDALRTLAALSADTGGGVHGIFFHGRRLDTGNKQDYVRATVELACTRPDIAGEFVPWLRQYTAALGNRGAC